MSWLQKVRAINFGITNCLNASVKWWSFEVDFPLATANIKLWIWHRSRSGSSRFQFVSSSAASHPGEAVVRRERKWDQSSWNSGSVMSPLRPDETSQFRVCNMKNKINMSISTVSKIRFQIREYLNNVWVWRTVILNLPYLRSRRSQSSPSKHYGKNRVWRPIPTFRVEFAGCMLNSFVFHIFEGTIIEN